MPTPEKTSTDAIVDAARELLEANGLARLTMQSVAEAVGVRAPSLYKRVESRDVLLRLVAEATLDDLAERLDAAPAPRALADAFRAFGHERPAAFQLVMTPGPGALPPRLEHGAAASRAILRTAGALAGADHALEAGRTLTAWAAGFVIMELNQGFNLGGSVEDAWDFGVERVFAAIAVNSGRGSSRG